MANMRQNIGVGGLYPTGRAPLAVDLATPTAAITQRMIERERNRISQEKEQISETQQMILKALDFETVQGLSDKIQEQHLDGLNQLSDKWADIFAANDGKLNFKQQKELLNDKRKVEGDLAKMQSDVKTFTQAQNLLNTKPELWDEQSWLNLSKYASDGKIGSGEAINILVPRKPSFIEHIQSTYKNQMTALEKRISNRFIGVGEEGRVDAMKDNLDSANSVWGSLKQQPDVKRYIDQIGEDQAKEQFLNMYGFSLADEKHSSSLYREQNREKPETDYYSRKYGWGVTDKSQLDNITYMNDFVERVYQLDSQAIDMMKVESVTGIGVPEDIYVDMKDGRPLLVIEATRTKKEIEGGTPAKKIKIPYPNRDNPDDVKDFKMRVLNLFSAVDGKQKPLNISKYIEPNWQEVKKDIEPQVPIVLSSIRKMIETGVSTRAKKAQESLRKDIAEGIRQVLPDVEVDTNWYGKEVVIRGEGKNGGDLKFSVKNKEDRQKLLDWLNNKVQYEQRMKEMLAPRVEAQPDDSMDKLREEARNDALQRIDSLGFQSMKEYIDFYIEQGLDEETVRRTIEQIGLTEDDFK